MNPWATTDLLLAGAYSEVIERHNVAAHNEEAACLVEALSRGGFHKHALALTERLGAQLPRGGVLVLQVLSRSGQPDAAITYAEANLDSHHEFQSALAAVYIQMGLYAKADPILRQLLNTAVNMTDPILDLLLVATQEFLEEGSTSPLLRKVAEEFMTHCHNSLQRCRFLVSARIVDYDPLAVDQETKQMPIGRLLAARRLLSIGDVSGAFEEITLAFKLESANAELHECYADCCTRSGFYHEAIVHYEKARDLDRSKIRYEIGLYRTFIRLRRFDEAVDGILELYSKHPLNREIHWCLTRLRRGGAAVPSLTQWIRRLATDVGLNAARSGWLMQYLQDPPPYVGIGIQ